MKEAPKWRSGVDFDHWNALEVMRTEPKRTLDIIAPGENPLGVFVMYRSLTLQERIALIGAWALCAVLRPLAFLGGERRKNPRLKVSWTRYPKRCGFTHVLLCWGMASLGCSATPQLELGEDGGQWAPFQLAEPAHQARLQALGLDPIARSLTEVDGKLLGAMVDLGGCPGVFVSVRGLILTTRWCLPFVAGLERGDEDLERDGFAALDVLSERALPEWIEARKLLSSHDVTQEVRSKMASGQDPEEFRSLLGFAKEQVQVRCERETPEVTCKVVDLYDNNLFRLERYQKFHRIRLVYAPPRSLEEFGNRKAAFAWPQFPGEFIFVRAVNADGSPVHSPNYLKVRAQTIASGEPVAVLGYLNATSRSRPSQVADSFMRVIYSEAVEEYQELLSAHASAQVTTPEEIEMLGIRISEIEEARERSQGMVDENQAQSILGRLVARDAALERWIQSDPKASKDFAEVMNRVRGIHARPAEQVALGFDVWNFARFSRLFQTAKQIQMVARSRINGKATSEDLVQGFAWNFDRMSWMQPSLERKVLLVYLTRLFRNGGAHALRAMLGLSPSVELNETVIESSVEAIITQTKLFEAEFALKMYKTATPESLEALDPMLALVSRWRRFHTTEMPEVGVLSSEMDFAQHRFSQALRAYYAAQGLMMAPDVKRDLRVVYGRVAADASTSPEPRNSAFSTAGEFLRAQASASPSSFPQALRVGLEARDFGACADPLLQDLVIGYTSQVDLPPWRTSAATVNARGELMGLALRGNKSWIPSGWIVNPSSARVIHLDLRYLLWFIDKVQPSAYLVSELGLEPGSACALR